MASRGRTARWAGRCAGRSRGGSPSTGLGPGELRSPAQDMAEPRLLKMALARGRGRSCDGRVTQVGDVRHRSAPSLGCALTWGSLRWRTPRSALAYTPRRAPDADASGAGDGPAPLDLRPVYSNGTGVPYSWGVCSGQKDASFVGTGGCVRAVRARGARRPGTSKGLSRHKPVVSGRAG